MILFRTLKIEITIRVHSTGSNVQQKAKFSQRQFLWKWERDCLNNFFRCNDHHRNQSHHHPHHWGQLYIYINLGKLNVRGFKLKLNGILTFPLFDDCITIILSSLHTTIKLNNNRGFVLQVIIMGEVWIQPRAIKMISYGSRKTNLCKVTCKRNIHWRLFPWKRKMCEISWPLLTLMILVKVESHIPWESGWTSEEDPHFHFSFFPLKVVTKTWTKRHHVDHHYHHVAIIISVIMNDEVSGDANDGDDDDSEAQVSCVRETNWCFQGIAYVLHLRIPTNYEESRETTKDQHIKTNDNIWTYRPGGLIHSRQRLINHRIPKNTTNERFQLLPLGRPSKTT